MTGPCTKVILRTEGEEQVRRIKEVVGLCSHDRDRLAESQQFTGQESIGTTWHAQALELENIIVEKEGVGKLRLGMHWWRPVGCNLSTGTNTSRVTMRNLLFLLLLLLLLVVLVVALVFVYCHGPVGQCNRRGMRVVDTRWIVVAVPVIFHAC